MMEVAKITDTGKKRDYNQDQVEIFHNTAGQPLLLLCDGMGGHNAGDVAAEMALFQVGSAWGESGSMNHTDAYAWLSENIRAANQRIYEKSLQFRDLAGMGTTLVGAAILEGEAIIAHVGDSRAYLLSESGLRQVTTDHSYVQELVNNHAITSEEAQHHPQKNLVTRSIGIDAAVEIDFQRIILHTGDMILLCSDGLTDMLSNEEIEKIISHYPHLEDSATELVTAANQAGGKDNISVVLARVEGSDAT